MVEMDDVIKGYEYLATLDLKTCLLCAALDGRRFKRREDVPSHLHENCRCTVVPVTALSDLVEEERPGENGTGHKRFADYFQRLSPEEKKICLGDLRYRIWQKYHPELSAFVDLDELREYTDDELLKKYPLECEEKIEEGFSAELEFVPYFNLALQQNALPVIHQLKLHNKTSRELKNLSCTFSAKPEFLRTQTFPVNDLKVDSETTLDDLTVELDYDLLASLSESLKGYLELEIKEGDRIIFRQTYPCEAFAPDQWLGMGLMPELLVSFVTPNLDVVTQLQSSVADELERATGSSAVQGYQADKKRVYEICAAIYRAIHNWGIRYSNPPSSFGTPGQRIRFADAVYQYKLGTCLDTTLLFASVMESCGLHPVIMVQEGHAYIGCHLENYYFPDIPMDDLQMIRKLAVLDEFVVIETTHVTGDATFAEAEAAALEEHLNIDGRFECAIDVVRARHSNILPLPLKRSVNGVEFAPVERKIALQEAERARRLEREIDLSKLSNESDQSPRVKRWQSKLLDLTLRNRLLNIRNKQLVIPVACADISVLEDKLSGNESLSVNALSDLVSEKDLLDMSMLRNSNIKSEIKELLEEELEQKRLWSPLAPGEMNRRLTALYRQGKNDLEEGGVNTLFLAVGFLEWKAAENDEKSCLAPILLIPVRLQRRSIAEGIRVSRLDGETQVNETLLELLRSQYRLTVPGLSPLPADESGADVALIMQIFRQTIRNMKGWEVREEACIGHFSFGKFVMWNDMHGRLEELKRHPLIEHLISGSGFFEDGIEVFPPEKISSHLDLSRLYCPVSADASQLTAVLYSELGKSFVLHGPPGTGKSQTITNIIAHNLALGKKVLFVSEKKAALDVVHKRLSQIGLKPFCLELHSNKSGKTEVLAQFNEALQTAAPRVPEEWEHTVNTLSSLRSGLDGYVRELHCRYPNGFSAYDCFIHLLGHKGELPDTVIQTDFLTQSREDQINARQKFIDLADALKGVDEQSLKALEKIDLVQWSPILEKELLSSAGKLQKAIRELVLKFDIAAGHLGLQGLKKLREIHLAALLLETLKSCEDTPKEFFSDDFPEKAAFIAGFAENAGNYLLLKEKLSNCRLERFQEFDFPGIAQRIKENESAFILIRFFRNRALLKELSVLKKSGGVPLSIKELSELLPQAQEYVQLQKLYDSGKERAARILDKQWNDENTNWEGLAPLFENTRKILDSVSDIAGPESALKENILKKLQELMPSVSRKCSQDSPLRSDINDMIGVWNIFQETLQNFCRYASHTAGQEDLSVMLEDTENLIKALPRLRNVLRYRNLLKQVREYGWGEAAQMLANDSLSLSPADLYDLLFFRNMLDRILNCSPLLCSFSGSSQNEKIKNFGEFDQRYMDLTCKLIFARLAANLPRRRTGPEGTPLGFLRRECEKRARQKPVRQLLEQISPIALDLKPCFLMSPLSVAQYLPADHSTFDLIVFDEASQIPVWDAIGVIARGKQLIVVGDPKQMPPTNFFQKGENDGEEDSFEDTEDLESILDECLAAGVHQTRLNWHYRSRHESLIAFSNHHYYEDRLFTFPAARNSETLGIRFEFVPDGVYDRKSSRTNRKEAEAMVKYIFDRLERSNGKYRSIGVVTFSQAQKDLIEDLIEKERAAHPALESCFSESAEEPLFVKNLENVQGDERDVILFSIGYAPDAAGKFSMNFGPLNRKGGERRLNVAITRAKEQVVVFSSIHAHQIDLNRTNAVGAAHLKYFLDYAEKNLTIGSIQEKETTPDGLRETIAEFLTEKGFKVEQNVGCSGFRIDLAVCHPEHPDEYLLGIECDNAAYAAQRTTRDRDNLRHQVLKGLGWHTFRAWSVDWTFDRERSEKELLEYLEKIKDGPSPLPPPPPQAEPVPAQGSENEVPAAEASPVEHPHFSENRQAYQIWECSEVPDQESFYSSTSERMISQQMLAIIEKEAPIYEQLLKKRVARGWGFNRTGGNILKILNGCLPKNVVTTQYAEDRVFWAPGQKPSEYTVYRAGETELTKRAIDEIPPEELANAMCEVLTDYGPCGKEILFRETVKRFGLSALTAKAKKYLEYGFSVLEKSNRI